MGIRDVGRHGNVGSRAGRASPLEAAFGCWGSWLCHGGSCAVHGLEELEGEDSRSTILSSCMDGRTKKLWYLCLGGCSCVKGEYRRDWLWELDCWYGILKISYEMQEKQDEQSSLKRCIRRWSQASVCKKASCSGNDERNCKIWLFLCRALS